MKLQPLKEFVENPELGMTWKPCEEFIICRSEHQRFRIIVENGSSEKYNFIGPWREEKLAEEGISGACDDAKEFAMDLLNGPFNHLSPHNIMHLANALNRYLEEWRAERIKQYSKEFGLAPPTDFCTD